MYNLKGMIQEKKNLLYFVFDYKIFKGLKHNKIGEIISQAIDGGCDMIQYRDKIQTKKEIYYNAEIINKICKQRKIPFIMNDHLDIAISIGADGVHLGQDDFPVEKLELLLKEKKLIIGLSTHNDNEISEALYYQNKGVISYFNIGPIFNTQTKEHVGDGIGADLVKSVSLKYPEAVFSVMGGIKYHNIDLPIQNGSKIEAVVTDILNDDNIRDNTIRVKKEIERLVK